MVPQQKQGFTLVELSIVLVIIGLLISGILIGQSLIESAKVNSVVREVQQYTIAIEQFKNKYGTIPGDSSKVAPAATTSASQIPNNGILNQVEGYSAWSQLKNGLLPDLKVVPTVDNGGALNCPRSAWSKETTICIANLGPYVPYVLVGDVDARSPDGNFFRLDIQNQPVLSTSQSMAIDQKIDDGKPRNGTMYSVGSCVSGAVAGYYSWNTSNAAEKICFPYFIFSFNRPIAFGDSY